MKTIFTDIKEIESPVYNEDYTEVIGFAYLIDKAEAEKMFLEAMEKLRKKLNDNAYLNSDPDLTYSGFASLAIDKIIRGEE